VARLNPVEQLQSLNRAAIEGKLDVVGFLERNFYLPGNWFTHKPIRFEPWQLDNIIRPVLARDASGRRKYNIFLNSTGKKNGKSTLSAAMVMVALLLDDANPEVYSAAGDLDQARIIFRATAKAFERSPLASLVRIGRDTIERVDGQGFYQALAADASGSHGKNASCTTWDELWNQPSYDLWEALTLSPTRKDAFHFITTYAGWIARPGNLLYDLYSAGLRGDDQRMYMFWLDGDAANPASWITPEYLEQQRRRLPVHIFNRLHRNEWSLADEARVFRIAPESWQGIFQDPLRGSTYAIGVDLAKYKDFSAVVVLRTDCDPYRVVYLTKLPHVDYTIQAEMIAAMVKRFECPNKPKVLVDLGAAGPAVAELLRKAGVELEEFKFTSESKQKIVTDLAIAFEQRKIVLPQTGRTLEESRAIADLEKELFHFEPTVLKSGNIRYEGSGGYFDDLVIALCLAYAGALRKPKRFFMPEVWDVRTNVGSQPEYFDPQRGVNPDDPFLELPSDRWHRI
jgi:Phage Terminase/Terminase RNaseH-like domain